MLTSCRSFKKDGIHKLMELWRQRIDIATETIKLDRTTTTDAKGLANEITGTEPRYSFFRYSEENKEGESPPIISIYTFPSISGVTQVRTKGKERMVYATSKLAFFDAARDELGLNIVKSVGHCLIAAVVRR